jgi:hypothetical protein
MVVVAPHFFLASLLLAPGSALRPNGFTATTQLDLGRQMGATSIRTYDLAQIEAVASCATGLDIVAGVVSVCPFCGALCAAV